MQLDKATLAGLAAGCGGILAGFFLEGGKIYEILQPTAALIVFGGTLGATLVSSPGDIFLRAMGRVRELFGQPPNRIDESIDQIIELARVSRRGGILAVDRELPKMDDEFLKRCLWLAVDGTEVESIRKAMEIEINSEVDYREEEARVFETAGGYSPTIGIIGAVMGLIQVMKNLSDLAEVGHGIAVAFVATIYGVGLANLVLLPASKKLMIRARQLENQRHLTLEGVSAIVEGLNPRLIRSKLEGYKFEKRSVDDEVAEEA